MFDLTGRVAVVTGASSGLGVQFAKALAKQGADVVLMARRVEKLKEVAKEIEALGRKCLPLGCDVTDTAQIQACVAETLKAFGKVDILVNSAGVAEGGAAENHTDEQWNKVVDLNLTALFKVAREFGQPMIKQKYGRIINVASMYGLVGNNFNPSISYHASKGGALNFTRGLAAEWAKYGVTVNSLGPGFFASEMTESFIDDPGFLGAVKAYCPMGRVGKPEELDGALIYLASDEASYTTGASLFVDGGWTAI